jgi:LacI family transcriptional regulator, galactose operon repressor
VAQRKSGHVTLLDIAHACGFSVSTVSIVLSEAPLSRNVAASTRERIRAMARKLGYHPDAFARSLRSRRSHTIGILAYDLSDPFCIPIVRGIQVALRPSGYLPLLIDAHTERLLFDHYVRMVLERRAEGLIVIASWVFDENNLLADVKKNNVPVVIVGRDLTARGISSVLVDNETGGALAMRHLCELGHTRIAVIRGPEELFDSELRWTGIQRAAAEFGIRFDPSLVFQLPALVDPTSGFKGGVQFASQMLASRRPFTAVLAFDDLTALGVIRGLAVAGLRVPDDFSVMGFDDVMPASLATPEVTTIRQPLQAMGQQAGEWALKAIEARGRGRRSRARLLQASPELVARSSTSRPAKPGARRGMA